MATKLQETITNIVMPKGWKGRFFVLIDEAIYKAAKKRPEYTKGLETAGREITGMEEAADNYFSERIRKRISEHIDSEESRGLIDRWAKNGIQEKVFRKENVHDRVSIEDEIVDSYKHALSRTPRPTCVIVRG